MCTAGNRKIPALNYPVSCWTTAGFCVRYNQSRCSWLLHIAVNVVRDFARNRRLQFWRRAPSIDPTRFEEWLRDPSLSPEANLLAQEHVRGIWEAAQSVSPKQRTVFLLRFVEEKRFAIMIGFTMLAGSVVACGQSIDDLNWNFGQQLAQGADALRRPFWEE